MSPKKGGKQVAANGDVEDHRVTETLVAAAVELQLNGNAIDENLLQDKCAMFYFKL